MGGDVTSEPLSKARIAKITLMTGPGSGSTLALPRPDDAILAATDPPSGSHAP